MSAPNAKSKPAHVAKVGNVRVPVYRIEEATRTRWCVAYRLDSSSPRTRRMFSARKDAIAHAQEVARAIADSQADVLTLSSADRESYRQAVLALRPLEIPLHSAIEEYLAVKSIMGEYTLSDLERMLARERKRAECPPTSQVLTFLLDALRDNRRSEKYIQGLQWDLSGFAQACPDLPAVTEEDIRSYLSTRPVGERRRDNIRDAISRLMNFARDKGWLLPGEKTAVEKIEKIAEGRDIVTLTPDQLRITLHYFAANEPQWLPWVALAAFAGLRTSEIFRLDWSALRWDVDVISIKSSVARKIRISRVVPILPALRAWLLPWRKEKGLIVAKPGQSSASLNQSQSRALARFRASPEWKSMRLEAWPKNVLRHSFGSHRLAALNNMEQLRLEMGNSPTQIREHYNDPKSQAEAAKYFAVLPLTNEKSTAIPFPMG